MKVIFEKNDKRMLSVNVTFGAGALLEVDGYKTGLAHMLEHMMFKGTSTRSYEDIARQIEFLGGYSNAFTSFEQVSYQLSIPRENIDQGTDILFDMVLNSTISQEEFDKEKEVVLEELYTYRDEVDYNFNKEISDKFFSGRRRVDVIGLEEDVKSITRDDLVKFYKQFYTSSNCILGISGDIDGHLLEKTSQKLYHNDGVFENMCIAPEHEYKNASKVIVKEPNLEQSHVCLLFKSPHYKKLKDPKYFIFNTIFGSGMASRLFMEVREKNNLCYNINSHFDYDRDYSMFDISAITREQNIPKLLDIVNVEIEKIKNEKVSEYELQGAKNQMLSAIYSILDDKNHTLSYRIKNELLGNDFDYYKKTLSTIPNINPGDIMDVANEVLDDSTKFECLLIKE